MLKNEKPANRNEHQNRKTEVFWHKNRKTHLKNSQNRKSQCPPQWAMFFIVRTVHVNESLLNEKWPKYWEK